MRGHVRKRCPSPIDGADPCKKNCGHSWAYVIEQPAPQDGRRRQVWKSGFRTRKEAEAALATALANGQSSTARDIQASVYFRDWLAHLDRKPATMAIYRRIVNDRLVPAFGSLHLADLTADLLRRQYAEWLRSGLSSSSVQLMHQVLNKALGDAERAGTSPRNVARSVDAPRKAHREMQTWTREQIVAFLAHVEGDRLAAMWRLLLTTGMRRGEVAALRWPDVDLEARRLSIRWTGNMIDRKWTVGTPKGRGRGATRMLSLDAKTARALREHRDRQQTERDYADKLWEDHGLVFCRETGVPLNPTRIGHRLTAHAKKASLPPIRVHDYADLCVMPLVA